MAKLYIAPLGFIERLIEDGATFTLTNPKDSLELRYNTPVTVWRYSPEQLALAKIRGLISAVGYVTATFRTVESLIDPSLRRGHAQVQTERRLRSQACPATAGIDRWLWLVLPTRGRCPRNRGDRSRITGGRVKRKGVPPQARG